MTRLVVWDVDGTLTRTDTLLPFLVALRGRRVVGAALAEALAHCALQGPDRTAAKDVVLRVCLGNIRHEVADQVGREFAGRILSGRVRPDALTRWRSHAIRGDRQVLASASLGCYLIPLGDLLGADTVICTELENADGLLSGRRSTPNCRGHEKARRIREVVQGCDCDSVWMYSDSASDSPSFALADVAVRVRPWRWIRAEPDATCATATGPA